MMQSVATEEDGVEGDRRMNNRQRRESFEVQFIHQERNRLADGIQEDAVSQLTPIKQQQTDTAMSSPLSELTSTPSPAKFPQQPNSLIGQIQFNHAQGTARQQEAMQQLINQANGRPGDPLHSNNSNSYEPTPIEQYLAGPNGQQAGQHLMNHIGARDAQAQGLGLVPTFQHESQKPQNTDLVRSFQPPPNEFHASSSQPNSHMYPSMNGPALPAIIEGSAYMGSPPQNYSSFHQYPNSYHQYPPPQSYGLPSPNLYQGLPAFASQYSPGANYMPTGHNRAHSHNGVISESGQWGQLNGYGSGGNPAVGSPGWYDQGAYTDSVSWAVSSSNNYRGHTRTQSSGYSPTPMSAPNSAHARSQSAGNPITPVKGQNLPSKPQSGRFSPTTKPLPPPPPGLPSKPENGFRPGHKRTQSSGSPLQRKNRSFGRSHGFYSGQAREKQNFNRNFNKTPAGKSQKNDPATSIESSPIDPIEPSQRQKQIQPIEDSTNSPSDPPETVSVPIDHEKIRLDKLSPSIDQSASIEEPQSTTVEVPQVRKQNVPSKKAPNLSKIVSSKENPIVGSTTAVIIRDSKTPEPVSSGDSYAPLIVELPKSQISVPPVVPRRNSISGFQKSKLSPKESTPAGSNGLAPKPRPSQPAGRTRAPSFSNSQQFKRPAPASLKTPNQSSSPANVAVKRNSSGATLLKSNKQTKAQVSHKRSASPNEKKQVSSITAPKEKNKQSRVQVPQIFTSSPSEKNQTPSIELPKHKKRTSRDPESHTRSSPPAKRARVINLSAIQSEQERSSSPMRGQREQRGGPAARATPGSSASSSPTRAARRQHAVWPPARQEPVKDQPVDQQQIQRKDLTSKQQPGRRPVIIEQYPPPLTAGDIVAQDEYTRIFQMAQENNPNFQRVNQTENFPALDVGGLLREENFETRRATSNGEENEDRCSITQNSPNSELNDQGQINIRSHLQSLIRSQEVATAWSYHHPEEERLQKMFAKTIKQFKGAAGINPPQAVNKILTRYNREHPVTLFENTSLGRLQMGIHINSSSSYWEFPMFGAPFSEQMIDKVENGCTFCLHECDFGVSDESIWLPLDASGGYCNECHITGNDFASQWNEVMADKLHSTAEEREKWDPKEREKWNKIDSLKRTHNTPVLKELCDGQDLKAQAFRYALSVTAKQNSSPKVVMTRRASMGSAVRSPSPLSTGESSSLVTSKGSPSRRPRPRTESWPGNLGLDLVQGFIASSVGTPSTVITTGAQIPGSVAVTVSPLASHRASSPMLLDSPPGLSRVSEIGLPNTTIKMSPTSIAHPRLLSSSSLPDVVHTPSRSTSPMPVEPQILAAPSLPSISPRATSPMSIDGSPSPLNTAVSAQPRRPLLTYAKTMGPPPPPGRRTCSTPTLPPMKPLLTKPFDGVPFCRGCPWRKVDENKARICKPCRDLKWAIMSHPRHRDFMLLNSVPKRVDERGYPLLEDAKRKSCMICPKLAIYRCCECPLRVCSDCEVMLESLCKGEINGLLIHLDRTHVRNDAFLLLS